MQDVLLKVQMLEQNSRDEFRPAHQNVFNRYVLRLRTIVSALQSVCYLFFILWFRQILSTFAKLLNLLLVLGRYHGVIEELKNVRHHLDDGLGITA